MTECDQLGLRFNKWLQSLLDIVIEQFPKDRSVRVMNSAFNAVVTQQPTAPMCAFTKQIAPHYALVEAESDKFFSEACKSIPYIGRLPIASNWPTLSDDVHKDIWMHVRMLCKMCKHYEDIRPVAITVPELDIADLDMGDLQKIAMSVFAAASGAAGTESSVAATIKAVLQLPQAQGVIASMGDGLKLGELLAQLDVIPEMLEAAGIAADDTIRPLVFEVVELVRAVVARAGVDTLTETNMQKLMVTMVNELVEAGIFERAMQAAGDSPGAQRIIAMMTDVPMVELRADPFAAKPTL